MNDHANRLKRDLQTIQNALGVNLWTHRDVRRAFLGSLAGGAAGLFLALWFANQGAPVPGLMLFLVLLVSIHIGKAIGFSRQPASAAGSQREVAFFNRFYAIGGSLVGLFYVWGYNRGLDTIDVFASTVVMAGSWYLFYAISAPARFISLGGAVPLTACGFLLASARYFSEAISWLGIAVCIGCWAEAAWLYLALRPSRPTLPPAGAASSPIPTNPMSPLCDASH